MSVCVVGGSRTLGELISGVEHESAAKSRVKISYLYKKSRSKIL